MQWLFDDCVLDLDRRELSRCSQAVATAPRVFDLLAYLTENRERVVSRDDVIDAVWKGRIVSESTLDSHINAVRKAVGDDGRQQRIIRTVPRKGFRFVAEVMPAQSAGRQALAPGPELPALPSKPSIAVLPFVNLSADPEQDYLADGVVEDIIAALSRYRWLFVVARNSSFAYKGRTVDTKRIGRELGVRYVLEGSWRKAGRRVRLTGQLIDAASGAHHWAGRFDGILDDIFALQDRIAESVVGAIAPQLESAEIERAKHKPTGSLDAYDYYLRGMAKLHHGTHGTIDQALALFTQSIEADREFASAYAMAAWCHCWRKINGWMDDPSAEYAEGIRLARRAVELGRADAVALTRSGHALAHLGADISGGIVLLDKAIELNPNLAAAWFLGAYLRLWHGETETAVTYFTRAMRLSPLDPETYRMQAGMAVAHFFMGQYDVALGWAEKSLQDLPAFLMTIAIVAACHAYSNRPDQARAALARLRELNPALNLANLRQWLPIQRPENLAMLTAGLRSAGLPEE